MIIDTKSDFDTMQMKEVERLDKYAGKLNGMFGKYFSLRRMLDDPTML